jgi:hypothetical protein
VTTDRGVLAALLVASCVACTRGASRDTPAPPASAAAPTEPLPSAAASTPDASATPPDSAALDTARPRLAADVATREHAAKALFGTRTFTRVVGDTFVLVQPGGSRALFDQAAALLDRALPPLFADRFNTRPSEGVTVLFFPTHEGYAAYCRAHGATTEQDSFGVYRKSTREILADGSGGAAYLPTLTHEVVHALVESDFPYVAVWFEEGLASVFEAPVFTADGGIAGVPKNRRHPRLLAALANPRERGEVSLDALFAMGPEEFEARGPDGGVNASKVSLHYAMAREMAEWLEEQGKLWAFYRAWRAGVLHDVSGQRAFREVMGRTPGEANGEWVGWVRGAP